MIVWIWLRSLTSMANLHSTMLLFKGLAFAAFIWVCNVTMAFKISAKSPVLLFASIITSTELPMLSIQWALTFLFLWPRAALSRLKQSVWGRVTLHKTD